jgi:hypothetical protein
MRGSPSRSRGGEGEAGLGGEGGLGRAGLVETGAGEDLHQALAGGGLVHRLRSRFAGGRALLPLGQEIPHIKAGAAPLAADGTAAQGRHRQFPPGPAGAMERLSEGQRRLPRRRGRLGDLVQQGLGDVG